MTSQVLEPGGALGCSLCLDLGDASSIWRGNVHQTIARTSGESLVLCCSLVSKLPAEPSAQETRSSKSQQDRNLKSNQKDTLCPQPFFCLNAAWLNEGRCPGGRPSVSEN